MLARTALSLVNLGVLSATLTVWFLLPHYSTYALYGCLAWVVIAFALMYSAWGNRPLGTTGGAGAGLRGSDGSGGSRPPLDFCIYCATTLPVGASRCPACGHAGARG
jgi:hypothetical protein